MWAFAAIVAVEFGVETHNGICDGSLDVLKAGGKGPNTDTNTLTAGWLNGFIQCSENAGQPDCKINFPRSFKFKTGRKDCTDVGDQPYIGVLFRFLYCNLNTKHEMILYCSN